MNGIRSESSASRSQVLLAASRDSSEIDENCSLLNCNMRQKLARYKAVFAQRNLLVDCLSICFGIAAWIGITSTFLQLPLLVASAPEGWSLPSYLVLIVQAGNIGPISYTILHKILPGKIKDAHIIYGVLLIGTTASIVIAFMYKKTSFIGDKEYSLALFILVFFLALLGCTSSVLFMPYMGRFREIYLITYLIGEGLSGFITSIVALVQGVGGNAQCIPKNFTNGSTIYERYTPPPRFDTKIFYIFVFCVMVCSCIAFFLLENLKICKQHYAAVKITHGNDYVYGSSHGNENNAGSPENIKILSPGNYKLLLLLMAAVCVLGNGVLPSIQSYSCLPYGNVVYHLTAVLTAIANPAACFLAMFLPHTSIRSIVVMMCLTVVLGSYTLATALLSPLPPLVNHTFGEALVVMCWTILFGIISYIKLSITAVMRSQGGKSLVWTGGISQAGSAVGSIIIFLLINVANLFTQYDPC